MPTLGQVTYLVGAKSDVGRLRKRNEDAFRVEKVASGTWFVAVADGVGSGLAGDYASQYSVEVMTASTLRWNAFTPPQEVAKVMRRALLETHTDLMEQGKENKAQRGMSTTIVCAALLPTCVIHMYAGDSPLFHFRGDELLYRTTPHKEKGKLTSYLGGSTTKTPPQISPEPGYEILEVKAGDSLVLCSDGLENMTSPRQIQQLIRDHSDPQQLAERLVKAALHAGGEDNVTAIVIHVIPAED